MSRSILRDEVVLHNKRGDMWLTIDGRVYDVSKFAAMHPGGEAFIYKYAGKVAKHLGNPCYASVSIPVMA